MAPIVIFFNGFDRGLLCFFSFFFLVLTDYELLVVEVSSLCSAAVVDLCCIVNEVDCGIYYFIG